MIELTGIFIIKRGFGNTVVLSNPQVNIQKSVDYFEFEKSLYKHFSKETITKILDYINNSEKVLLDFDKCIAKLIATKQYDFNKVIPMQLNKETIENVLTDINIFGDTSEIENFKQL